MKKALKIAGIVLLALLILVLGYVAYVFLDYHRIEDNLPLTAEGLPPERSRPALPTLWYPTTWASGPMSRITASLWTAAPSLGPGPRSGWTQTSRISRNF
ncbi:MAG: hypothetical protein ACLUNQ_04780 [Oscillospiraceae bacterium]